MRRCRIKICCISSIEEAKIAITCGADALGLVGDMPSGPGVIDSKTIHEIARSVPPAIETFLLSYQSTAQSIAKQVNYCGTGTVQIVQHIAKSEYPQLMQLLPSVKLVQVIHVENESAISLIEDYEPYVHAFLLDSGRPSAGEFGGTGRTHNWNLSAKIVKRTSKPVFLAGGLSATNVVQAIHTVAPFGLDLCSSVRTHDKLDAAKLSKLFKNVSRTYKL